MCFNANIVCLYIVDSTTSLPLVVLRNSFRSAVSQLYSTDKHIHTNAPYLQVSWCCGVPYCGTPAFSLSCTHLTSCLLVALLVAASNRPNAVLLVVLHALGQNRPDWLGGFGGYLTNQDRES
jgi:hypothetical protein